jgi:predicted O-methyltransferase YrrM
MKTTYDHVINSKDFRDKLRYLNSSMLKAMEIQNVDKRLIGNLFYDHGAVLRNQDLNTECDPKRRRFFQACQMRTSMFEIGLNGGHSAFLCLMANPEIKVVSNDLAEKFIFHPEVYTIAAAKALSELFPSRFTFIKGNCLEVVPDFVSKNPGYRIDIAHIDGAKHTYKQDVLNLLKIMSRETIVILDDFQQGGIRRCASQLISEQGFSKMEAFPQMQNIRLTNEILIRK